MGFRVKLIFLAVLVNLLLGGVVWQLVAGVQAVKKQVRLFVPATHYLQGISAVHSVITRQTKEALDYLISHKDLDKKQFLEIDRNL